MTDTSASSLAAARRLWERCILDSAGTGDTRQTAERLLADLGIALRRWIGADGYNVLLSRAVVLAGPACPVLVGTTTLGLARTPPQHGGEPSSEEIAAGIIALLASLMTLLGRIIGDDMAVRLIEQVGGPSPRGFVSTQTNVGRDD